MVWGEAQHQTDRLAWQQSGPEPNWKCLGVDEAEADQLHCHQLDGLEDQWALSDKDGRHRLPEDPRRVHAQEAAGCDR
jgi:hypothetical protein